MASTYLHRTMSSGDLDKWTLSVWVKRTKLGANQRIITVSDNSSYDDNLRFDANDCLVFIYNNQNCILTRRQFRDCTGWMHICLKVDAGQASANDRVVLYINGVDERTQAGYSTDAMPAQNQNGYINKNVQHVIGMTNPTAASNHFDGLMSHYHFTDGYAYTASSFGSTDSTTGEWKITTSPSVTYGTNGFWILKDGNSLSDQSSNSNDFTLGGGTLTKTEDNPSNNFATLSTEVVPANSGVGSSNGGNEFGTSAAQWHTEKSHFGVSSGKWYFEVKMLNNGGGDRRFRWGFQKEEFLNVSGNNSVIGGSGQSAVCFYTGGHPSGPGGYEIAETGTTLSGSPDINTDNAIYGFALDLDNLKMYGHMSGTWFNSANPNTPTGGIDISSHVSAGDTLFPVFTTHLSTVQINFGNGYTGTSAVSSAGTNASGLGIFEYDVPTGYTALCTKGLNE